MADLPQAPLTPDMRLQLALRKQIEGQQKMVTDIAPGTGEVSAAGDFWNQLTNMPKPSVKNGQVVYPDTISDAMSLMLTGAGAIPGLGGIIRSVKAAKGLTGLAKAKNKLSIGGIDSLNADEMKILATAQTAKMDKRKKAFNMSSTDMPTYDNMIKNPEYFKRAKGLDSKMTDITPQQYLDKAAAGGRGSKGPEIDSAVVKKYAEKMRNGEQFPALTLDYSSGTLTQEGRHRALAAIEAGIDRVPVLEVRRVD